MRTTTFTCLRITVVAIFIFITILIAIIVIIVVDERSIHLEIDHRLTRGDVRWKNYSLRPVAALVEISISKVND
jgi:hypothetical protein